MCSLKAQDCFTTDEGPLCMCPKCDYIDVHPVCGQVADEISTFDNLCSLRSKACVENVDYFVLDDKECEGLQHRSCNWHQPNALCVRGVACLCRQGNGASRSRLGSGVVALARAATSIIFVATKVLLRQNYVCCDTIFLS